VATDPTRCDLLLRIGIVARFVQEPTERTISGRSVIAASGLTV
jgi:hypothetical protein